MKHKQAAIKKNKKNFCTDEYAPTNKRFCLLFVKIVFTSSEQDTPHMFHQQSGIYLAFLFKANVENEMCLLNFFKRLGMTNN